MNNVQELDSQIENLVNQRESMKEAIFKKASSNWFELLNAEYESSSIRTPQYLTFCRVFKKQFSKLLRDNFEVHKIEISKPNHFDAHGYVQLDNGNIFNFFIGDLRWFKTFTIRSAESFTDYSGGTNNDLNTDNFESFMDGLKRVIK